MAPSIQKHGLDVLEDQDELPNILFLSSSEAQEQRRSLLLGRTILIVQGGCEDKAFIYVKLMQLGLKVTILDSANTIWKSFAESGKIDEFIQWNSAPEIGGEEALFSTAMSAIGTRRFDAVTTYYEDSVITAARVANALGVAINDVQASRKARNKLLTRMAMEAAGLPAPKFHLVAQLADLAPACSTVGFPAILKPVYGAASMGVTMVESIEEAIEAYEKIASSLDVANDGIWAQGSEMILEEFYDGDEFDVDLLLSNGKSVYAKVSDNWACLSPWFQEIGTNCPSLYSQHKQLDLIQLAERTTVALGFDNGCFHVELKYTSRGARIIEVNARMGGVAVRDANLKAWGVDLVEEHAMASLGIPIRPFIPTKPLRFYAECLINAPYSGVICNEQWLDFTKEDDRVDTVRYMKRKGSNVIGPEDGVPEWIGEVVVVSMGSATEALELVRKIIMEQAEVPIMPNNRDSEKKFFFPCDSHPFALACKYPSVLN